VNILYVASEAVPYAKTGGLADVAGALPLYLARRGHTISVVLPYYKSVRDGGFPIRPTEIAIRVPAGGETESARVHEAAMEGKGRFLFIENPEYFEAADGLYGTPKGDYPNNAARFAIFCKAVGELAERSGEPVEIVHCNDWQSALLPVYLKLRCARSRVLGAARSLLTIHNLAYQGSFPAAEFPLTGLPEDLFRPFGGLEFYGRVNFLKGGISFADAITTVSPRYAEEIQTPEFGAGLDGVLRTRSDRLFGILNGIDVETWNPATDSKIPARYSMEKLAGKRRCKEKLQAECGLEVDPSIPLIGMITRLSDQKGLDLVVPVLDRLRREKFQLVLLGTGDERYHRIFADLGKKRKRSVSVHLKFDDPLAHRIEAGSDIFLMPSRYEPCGLNQMYSLRYGTVPVVRATGGLADTVVDRTEESSAEGRATGFRFEEYTPEALEEALLRALALYPDRRAWLRLVRAGMSQDFSWERSAAEYEKLYDRLRAEPGAAAS
jgi:starch synthase